MAIMYPCPFHLFLNETQEGQRVRGVLSSTFKEGCVWEDIGVMKGDEGWIAFFHPMKKFCTVSGIVLAVWIPILNKYPVLAQAGVT